MMMMMMMMNNRILLPPRIIPSHSNIRGRRSKNYFSTKLSSRSLSSRIAAVHHGSPWLMFSSEDEDKIEWRYFYSFAKKKIVHESHLPEIAGHTLVSSSQGYLLTVDHDRNLVATNPLRSGAGDRILLPPTSALPNAERYERLYHKHMPKSIEEKRVCLYYKAILSPGARTAVVIYQRQLAFARVGDPSWTALHFPSQHLYQPEDVIFHKGRLHAIDSRGALTIYDLDRPTDPPFQSTDGAKAMQPDTVRRYLVESPCGDNLFLVVKCFHKIDTETDTNTDTDTETDTNTEETEELPRSPDYFKVYLLDVTTYTWNWMEETEKVAFFVGSNHSMSLSTRDFRDFPNIHGNCIYFTDDKYKKRYFGGCEVAAEKGKFYLYTKEIEPLYADDELDQLNWPPPMLFMPVLK